MGEVWRARDPRLGREVAIKVLPEALAWDRDRLSRFEQEARSASALNHPNIVTIYEVGRADSFSYIAMELVQGKTPRELVVEGPLPLRRLLPVAAQTADALARAHEGGIVHRDLKPENLMVTREGLVKVLGSAWPSSLCQSPEKSPRCRPWQSQRHIPASSWARSATCLLSRRAEGKWISARINLPWVRSSTSS
jgi:hypothetical protein